MSGTSRPSTRATIGESGSKQANANLVRLDNDDFPMDVIKPVLFEELFHQRFHSRFTLGFRPRFAMNLFQLMLGYLSQITNINFKENNANQDNLSNFHV